MGGSKWSLNPIPRFDHGAAQTPKCSDKAPYFCSGMTDGSSAEPNLEIVDRVMIPKDLKPGDYVLGWRWDCEESNQIWQSCSDVTVLPSEPDMLVRGSRQGDLQCFASRRCAGARGGQPHLSL